MAVMRAVADRGVDDHVRLLVVEDDVSLAEALRHGLTQEGNVVDMTPARQRPYVASSGNNSELNLVLG